MHPIIAQIEMSRLRKDLPDVRPGDQVRVYLRVMDRTQVFEGVVIARRGRGLSETITVRKVSYGVGVEKIIPLHAPVVETVEIVRRGRVRRAKRYYLRTRVGKSLRIRERRETTRS
ncbi:MAG: 50S ribosomal protein L19 [Acidobacteriota bacterium]|nr:50S ribosomal protein L19 [Acidobacteriota bacterium]